MPTAPTNGGTIVPTADEAFLQLVCADKDLLAAEFDAIIAASWARPPADTRLHPGPVRRPRRSRPPARRAQPLTRPPLPDPDGRARQRSPPGGMNPNQHGRKVGDRLRKSRPSEVTSRLARTFPSAARCR